MVIQLSEQGLILNYEGESPYPLLATISCMHAVWSFGVPGPGIPVCLNSVHEYGIPSSYPYRSHCLDVCISLSLNYSFERQRSSYLWRSHCAQYWLATSVNHEDSALYVPPRQPSSRDASTTSRVGVRTSLRCSVAQAHKTCPLSSATCLSSTARMHRPFLACGVLRAPTLALQEKAMHEMRTALGCSMSTRARRTFRFLSCSALRARAAWRCRSSSAARSFASIFGLRQRWVLPSAFCLCGNCSNLCAGTGRLATSARADGSVAQLCAKTASLAPVLSSA